MFDPGALGTLLIGLRSVEADFDFGSAAVGRPAPARSRLGQALALVAHGLRWLADRLEPVHLEADPAR